MTKTLLGTDEEVIQYKDYRKTFTPAAQARQLVNLAELTGNESILEPQAGLGAIIKQVHSSFPKMWVYYFELNANHNTQIFLSNDYTISLGEDFIQATNIPKFDRIIANPPFDNDNWYYHVKKMYDCLTSKGILVSLIPRNRLTNNLTDEDITKFRAVMMTLGVEIFPIENWVTNDDGSITELRILKMRKI